MDQKLNVLTALAFVALAASAGPHAPAAAAWPFDVRDVIAQFGRPATCLPPQSGFAGYLAGIGESLAAADGWPQTVQASCPVEAAWKPAAH